MKLNQPTIIFQKRFTVYKKPINGIQTYLRARGLENKYERVSQSIKRLSPIQENSPVINKKFFHQLWKIWNRNNSTQKRKKVIFIDPYPANKTKTK